MSSWNSDFRALFKLSIDVSPLFPYINAVIDKSEYYDNPHYIKFNLNDSRCALYPDHLIGAPFENRDKALLFFKQVQDFLNDLDAKKIQ